MLLMAKSTISTGPVSIAFCLFTRGKYPESVSKGLAQKPSPQHGTLRGSGAKPWYPCSSHQNSWDLWMFIPLKMLLIGIDPSLISVPNRSQPSASEMAAEELKALILALNSCLFVRLRISAALPEFCGQAISPSEN